MLFAILQVNRERILKLASENGISNIRVFGSVARNEDGPSSDLDLLVDIEKSRSLFDLINFKQELEFLLKVSVDVVTEEAIHWSIKEVVLREAIRL